MKTLAVFSGGMDSATLVCSLLSEGDLVSCLTVDYGQRHKKEIESAVRLCGMWGLEHSIIDLSSVGSLLRSNSQTGTIAVPHGHYAEEMMKTTVVPNRNMLLIAAAAAVAIDQKADRVAYGAHAGDHDIYPDCRPEFVEAMRNALLLCDWSPIELYVPFIHMHKGEIAALGRRLGVPFDLTWTCYEGREEPCGACGACQERIEAMEFAGL